MKYVLLIYMCSMMTGKCPSYTITGLEFSDHHSCVLMGYKYAFRTMEMMEPEDANLERLVAKFECKPVKVEQIIPPKKPKVST